MKTIKLIVLLSLCVSMQGCLGTIVGQTVDVAIEVVKIPFKVGAAVVDVVTPDGKENKKKSKEDEQED